MTRAILLHEHGGPETLRVSDVDVPPLKPDEIRLRHTAIGVNFHDIYVRTGLYRTLALPGIPGIEAVGRIVEIGGAVENLRIGDRVGYVSPQYGCYSTERTLPAALALKLPDAMTDSQGAATLMKALTACMLLRRVHRVSSGETILVHAAAGGVGQLLCGWAHHLGATVIGTVGSAAKAAVAMSRGADHCILYREEDVGERVNALTHGDGVAAAYDSVGKDTFGASIQSLGFGGHLVNFGQSSGPVEPFAPSLLATRSLSVTRPIIFHYLHTPALLREMAQETFAAFEQGFMRPIDPIELPLDQAGQAHTILAAGQSPGGIVLIP